MTRRLVATAALLAIAAGCTKGDSSGAARHGSATAPGSVSMDKWEHVDYAATLVPVEELAPLSLTDVQRIRGIIFGVHGRVFQDSTLQRWVASRPWYHADTGFTNERLQPRERENLDRVREAEANKHSQIEPGDMRFYQNRVITSAMLGTHSPQDWEVIQAEVLANHGFVFSEEEEFEEDNDRALSSSDLQKYFDDRYWYERRGRFAPSRLSVIERNNLDTITVALSRQLGLAVSPGMMDLFRSSPLTETMLANVSIADLRLLRNEIYARHGRPFQTPWLAERFRIYPWYQPRAEYSDAELSPIEKANIALIARREQEAHDALSTRELGVRDVRGLRPGDARRLRNEIFARHGRRFRDPMLQRYFASFSWYTPSDSFSEDQLNATERKNVDLISKYEQGRFREA